jgi:hypothetical protein
MLKTKSGLPKHCTYNAGHNGKKRVRFLRRGVVGYPKGIPWSPEFMQEYAVLLERTEKNSGHIGADRVKSGTFGPPTFSRS